MVGGDPEAEEMEMTFFGLPKTWDGAVAPYHIFYVRSATDVEGIDWPRMDGNVGLQWAIHPLTSRKRANKDADR